MPTYPFQTTYFDDPPVEGRIMDVFLPDSGKPAHGVALFIIHGGGWRGGRRDDFHWLMRPLAARGMTVCSTDYRLKGTKVGQQVEDIRLGYALFLKQLKETGGPDRVAVYGSSAGAHLALLLALAKPGQCGDALLADPELRKLAAVKPAAAIVQAAPLTFELWDEIFPHGARAIENIVGAKYSEHPELFRKASPMRYVGKDSPPVFQMVSENEHFFPRNQSAEFAKLMKRAGRRVKTKLYRTAEHGFFFELQRRIQKEAYKDFLNFLDSL